MSVTEAASTEAASLRALAEQSGAWPFEEARKIVARLKKKPKVLVSASAIGYYGNRGDTWVTEKDAPGDDFLGRLSTVIPVGGEFLEAVLRPKGAHLS